jgi:endonuclease YncB( thermonuclease family)
MTKQFLTIALLSSVWISAAPAAFAQQMSMQPGYNTYGTSGAVPTLNLPPQYDPTIGQVDQPSSQEIIRSQGETHVSDPNVAPAQPTDNEETSTTDPSAKPLASRENSINTPGSAVGQTSDRTKKRYVKGMILEGKVHVGDGHSLLVGNDPVRLNGIEAPGLKQMCFTMSGAAWRCGQAAAGRLKALAEGRKATCWVDAPAGEGAAATCTVQGIADLGRQIVEEGMAVTNQHSPEVYEVVQSQAKHDKAGLWVGTFDSPATWRKKNR